MKLDPHEDKMRNKLSSQRINIDTDKLWNKLEEFVPEQKPRRPKAVFLLWPLLFISISLGLFSPYRYASAFTSARENFQNDAIVNTKASTSRENVKEIIAQTTSSLNEDTELDQTNSIGFMKASKSNALESKSYKSIVNFSHGTEDKSASFNEEVNLSKNAEEANITEQGITNWKVEIEKSRSIAEPFDKLNVLEMSILNQKPYKTKKFKRIIRPKPKQLVLRLGMSAGAVVQQHLQAHTAEFDLLNKQKKTDTGRELLGLQLGITYPLSKKFYVRSGLNYTRATTQLSISEDRYTRVRIEGIHGVWEDNLGNVHHVEGPVHATRKINYQTNWTSYHHILDIPLLVGFRLLHYKRNLISVEAGATYHMMHSFQGAVWDSEFYLNHDASVSDNFTYNRFSVCTAIEWEYRLSTTYSLFAGVQANDILLKNAGNDLSTKKRMYLVNGIVGVKLYPGSL